MVRRAAAPNLETRFARHVDHRVDHMSGATDTSEIPSGFVLRQLSATRPTAGVGAGAVGSDRDRLKPEDVPHCTRY
ncbi:hypothetical protein JCM10369A_25420 [Nocardioides pyridinolyticus]